MFPDATYDSFNVLDLTDPKNPSSAFLPRLELDSGGHAAYAGTEGGSMTFLYVVGSDEHSVDLSYGSTGTGGTNGTDAFKAGRSVVRTSGMINPIPGVILPEPGTPNSLSHGRAIEVYGSDPDTHFVTSWEVPGGTGGDGTGDDDGQTVTIPVGGSKGNYTVYWGDGNADWHVTGDQSNAYENPGNYTVRFSDSVERVVLGDPDASPENLRSIMQWGDARWSSMAQAFEGASQMTHDAQDAPDLSDASSTKRMFRGASSFDGDISGWNVSAVTDMSGMFRGASSFNADVSWWDVSAVTDMSDMFRGASSFNADVSWWDVSGASDMSGMFHGASSFERNLGEWYVVAVPEDATAQSSHPVRAKPVP